MLDGQADNLNAGLPKTRISGAHFTGGHTLFFTVVYRKPPQLVSTQYFHNDSNHEVTQMGAQIVPLSRPMRIRKRVPPRFPLFDSSAITLISPRVRYNGQLFNRNA